MLPSSMRRRFTMARKSVNGSAVREWANSEAGAAALAEAGLTVGTRGRFSEKVVELFQKSTKQKYEVGLVPTRKISGVRVNPDTGRKTPVTVSATLGEVRAWAAGQPDLAVGARGRVSQEVLTAFAARPKA
jgi:hypothetical protein